MCKTGCEGFDRVGLTISDSTEKRKRTVHSLGIKMISKPARKKIFVLHKGKASVVMILNSVNSTPYSCDTLLIVVCGDDSNCVKIDGKFDSRRPGRRTTVYKNRIPGKS